MFNKKQKQFKLGKLPAIEDKRDLKFSTYLNKEKVIRPSEFGHENLIPQWYMYANDKYGCCVFAGAGHEHRIWCAEGGGDVFFTDFNILKSYSDVTGFTAGDPSTDNGTYVREAMKYRQHVGIPDYSGEKHKIEAYVSINPRDLESILDAIYLFGAVGVGIRFPESAMRQFNAGKPWTVPLLPSKINGGHYIPLVAYRKGYFGCVTWGRLQWIAPKFLSTFCDEAWVMLSAEMFGEDKVTDEGFRFDELQRDLQALKVV